MTLRSWSFGRKLGVGFALVVGLACSAASASAWQEKAAEQRGAVVGVAVARGGYWIDIKAQGDDRPRRYYCGSNQAALKAVKSTAIGSRVRLEWRFEEVLRVVRIDVLKKTADSK